MVNWRFVFRVAVFTPARPWFPLILLDFLHAPHCMRKRPVFSTQAVGFVAASHAGYEGTHAEVSR